MRKNRPENRSTSVRDRLLKWSRENRIDFNRALLLYVQESFLYRLSKSRYACNFILKGGVLFYVSHQMQARPTRDIDFSVSGLNDREAFATSLKEILAIDAQDGIIFQTEAVTRRNHHGTG